MNYINRSNLEDEYMMQRGRAEPAWEVLRVSDLQKRWELRDEHMNRVFIHNKRNRTLTICLSYPYEIDLDRITSHASVLGWVDHLCSKTWMDTDHLGEFIKRVCKIKNIDPYIA